jgi:hypothetical protein
MVSTENSHAVYGFFFCDQKVGIWYAIRIHRIMRPVFLGNTINTKCSIKFVLVLFQGTD